MAERYPLSWPMGWKRTPAGQRQPARFHGTKRHYSSAPGGSSWTQKEPLTHAQAVRRLTDELRRLGVVDGDWILSSNLRVRLDGLPYSDQRQPDDPGVAVYFRLSGKDRVLACDQWNRVAGNIAAVAAHIEALRAIERYGVGSVEQAFAGYAALPPKGGTWRSALGFAPDQAVTRDAIDKAFRERARTSHPDVGGSHEAMAALTAARAEALAEANLS